MCILKNIIVIKFKVYLESLKKKFFKKFFLLIFQNLHQLQKLVVGSSSTELSEMTPSGRPTMVTKGGV